MREGGDVSQKNPGRRSLWVLYNSRFCTDILPFFISCLIHGHKSCGGQVAIIQTIYEAPDKRTQSMI
jgi:hypothetical protein